MDQTVQSDKTTRGTMRYTTIIDITEMPAVYRNGHARDLYLYMVLKSGYHNEDRDQLRKSIRSLAIDTGMSISAVRHALKVLVNNGLLQPMPGGYIVTKFVIEKKPTRRAQNMTDQQLQERARERALEQERRDREYEERVRNQDRDFEQSKATMEKIANSDSLLGRMLRSNQEQAKNKKR